MISFQKTETKHQKLKRLKRETELLEGENRMIKEKMKSVQDRIGRLEKERIKDNIIGTLYWKEIDTKVQVKSSIKIGAKICKIKLDSPLDKQ